jgi:poly(3-hydroxybutyrate) depolymerase
MNRMIGCAITGVLFLALSAAGQVDSFSNQGTMRTFIVHVPNTYTDPPLVINMHGMGSNADQQQMYAGFDQVADREGCIVVYPNGIDNTWDIMGSTDVDFISTLIDTLAARYPIDLDRVYATGFSMGGYMSHRLGCALGDRIAAIAPVSGLNASFFGCSPPRAVPVLQIHGTADSVVLFTGVDATVSGWVDRNGCSSTPVTTDPYPSGNPSSNAWMDAYGPCTDGSEVILIAIEGLGHAWPGAWGGGNDVEATEEIWAFFSRHSLNPSTVAPGRQALGQRSSSIRAGTAVRLWVGLDGDMRVSGTAEGAAHLLDGRRCPARLPR